MNEQTEQVKERCCRCGGERIQRAMYKLPFEFVSYNISQTLDKWHLNHVIEVTCLECGYKYNE